LIRVFIFSVLIAFSTAFAQLDVEWTEIYGGYHFDMIYDHIETADGGIAFTGYSVGEEGSGAWLGKTDANGELQWPQTHNFNADAPYSGRDYGYSLFEEDDGGFLIFG
jgi:hypothetical protein